MDPSAYMHQYGSNSGPPNHGQIPQVNLTLCLGFTPQQIFHDERLVCCISKPKTELIIISGF